jgi:hypothetical protein
MTIYSEKMLLNEDTAEEIVCMAKRSGWSVVLNEMMCEFGTNIEVDCHNGVLRIAYTDSDGETIDYCLPAMEGNETTIQVGGKYALHTIILEWPVNWPGIMTATKQLKLVNDTLRMRETRLDSKKEDYIFPGRLSVARRYGRY